MTRSNTTDAATCHACNLYRAGYDCGADHCPGQPTFATRQGFSSDAKPGSAAASRGALLGAIHARLNRTTAFRCGIPPETVRAILDEIEAEIPALAPLRVKRR